MASLPTVLERLIAHLKKIPGIGLKSAERMAFYLLNSDEKYIAGLSESLLGIKQLKKCGRCFALSDHEGVCEICASAFRDQSLLCVVETYRDLLVIEQAGEFKGLYHILEGHLSPLDGITPGHLKIKELVKRVAEGKIREIIVATNPNIEGDATAFYLSRLLKEYPVKITRLAKGLAVGSDLEYADALSLSNSFRNREQL